MISNLLQGWRRQTPSVFHYKLPYQVRIKHWNDAQVKRVLTVLNLGRAPLYRLAYTRKDWIEIGFVIQAVDRETAEEQALEYLNALVHIGLATKYQAGEF